MYSLTFNGEFQLEYPNEFMKEFGDLLNKHSCVFYGSPILRNLGDYIEFQKIETGSDTEADEKI